MPDKKLKLQLKKDMDKMKAGSGDAYQGKAPKPEFKGKMIVGPDGYPPELGSEPDPQRLQKLEAQKERKKYLETLKTGGLFGDPNQFMEVFYKPGMEQSDPEAFESLKQGFQYLQKINNNPGDLTIGGRPTSPRNLPSGPDLKETMRLNREQTIVDRQKQRKMDLWSEFSYAYVSAANDEERAMVEQVYMPLLEEAEINVGIDPARDENYGDMGLLGRPERRRLKPMSEIGDYE